MTTRIALVGEENLGLPSHREINAARCLLGEDVETTWVPTDSQQVHDLSDFTGIWLVPGSPYADDDAAYAAITWAREGNVPFLGTCGGLQYAVVEFSRNVLGLADASHAEVDGVHETNVVTPLACSLQGQERVVSPVRGSRFAALVHDRAMPEMHYCSYAPTPRHVERLVAGGMVVAATAADAGVEVLELPSNDFFVLSLFHPQVGALAGQPLHPLLREFARSAVDARRAAG